MSSIEQHHSISSIIRRDSSDAPTIKKDIPRTGLDTMSVVAKLQLHLESKSDSEANNKIDSPSNYSIVQSSPDAEQDVEDSKLAGLPTLQDIRRNDILQPQTSVGEYTVKKLVGKGGFAKVYKVRRKQDGQIFAVKVMRKEHVRKMKQALYCLQGCECYKREKDSKGS